MQKDLILAEDSFDPVLSIIENAKNRAIRVANAEMIQMYWDIGAYVSAKVKDGGWGKGIV